MAASTGAASGLTVWTMAERGTAPTERMPLGGVACCSLEGFAR